MKGFLPLLSYAGKPDAPVDLDALRYPLFGSVKLDGIRAIVMASEAKRGQRAGKLVSRKLKPIPNIAVRTKYSSQLMLGFDGELVAGDPASEDTYTRTSSVVMSHNESALKVRFYVFDWYLKPEARYSDRYHRLKDSVAQLSSISCVHLVEQRWIKDAAAAREMMEKATHDGYEGVMLRSPDAPYKFGRSTLREQTLLKIKLAEDAEAVVLAVLPRMHNTNEQQRDERGYAKRSSKKDGKQAMAEVGKFLVRDIKTKKEFECSTGVMTQEEREGAWRNRHLLKGKLLKYRFQPHGVKELPRFPRFIGWRSRLDL